jgi:hypothetical protein
MAAAFTADCWLQQHIGDVLVQHTSLMPVIKSQSNKNGWCSTLTGCIISSAISEDLTNIPALNQVMS